MDKRTCSTEDCVAEIRVSSKSGHCRRCARRAYYVAHRDHELATMAQWRTDNREHDRQRWLVFYAANREALNARSRAYNDEHKDTIAARVTTPEGRVKTRAQAKAWREANPERYTLKNRTNDARRRVAPGGDPIDLAAILARDGMTCHICGSEIPSLDDLHFDHVIPLSKGGPHSMGNIKPSHAFCNLSKGATMPEAA